MSERRTYRTQIQHPIRVCERSKTVQPIYTGKGYKARFDCPDPECGRNTYQSLNFLGSRKVFCDGQKFSKGHCCEELLITPGPGMNSRCDLPRDHDGECRGRGRVLDRAKCDLCGSWFTPSGYWDLKCEKCRVPSSEYRENK